MAEKNMEKILRKFNGFEEAEKADIEYWQNASYEERLNTLEAIRIFTYKFLNYKFDRIEKVVKLRKLKEEE